MEKVNYSTNSWKLTLSLQTQDNTKGLSAFKYMQIKEEEEFFKQGKKIHLAQQEFKH